METPNTPEKKKWIEAVTPFGEILSIHISVYRDGTSTCTIKGRKSDLTFIPQPDIFEDLSDITHKMRGMLNRHNHAEEMRQQETMLQNKTFLRHVLNSWQEKQVELYKERFVQAQDTSASICIGDALRVLWQLGWDTPIDWNLDPLEDTVWLSNDSQVWNKHTDLTEHPFWGLNWRSR